MVKPDDTFSLTARPSHSAARRRLTLGTAAALAAPGLAAAAEAGVSGSEIVIGQNISLQGGQNPYAKDAQQGIRVLLDEVNRSGGVHGRKLLLRTLDDGAQNTKAEANARQLVAEGCLLLFGTLEGGPSTAVMKVAVETGVPLVGPMAGAPGFRRPHQALVYPVRAEHREEFRALAQQGARIGLQRMALLHADTDVGREHLANAQRAAEAAGITGVGGLAFPAGNVSDTDVAALAAGLAALKPDLVLNHGSVGLYGRIIRAARNAGSKASFWGVNSGSSTLAAALGPLAHGMIFSQVVPNPQSGKTALAREYQAKMKAAAPDAPLSYGGLEGFMTAKALVAGLRATGPGLTRGALMAAMDELDADLGGVPLRWRRGNHAGSQFVDLSIVGRDGRFVQ